MTDEQSTQTTYEWTNRLTSGSGRELILTYPMHHFDAIMVPNY